jgi:hypothetical protein
MKGDQTMLTRTVVAGALIAGLAIAVTAQDHASCPMAASHARRDQVDHRHDEATGVAHEKAVHHFLLAKDGGSIHLEAIDSGDTEARDRIREHLQVVARSFAAGDFSLPMTIHDRVPPGAGVMKTRKGLIRYSYEPTEKGGMVRISTRDEKAKRAVHEFLRFQIRDHGTGDPTE